jgi:hypothetical protein
MHSRPFLAAVGWMAIVLGLVACGRGPTNTTSVSSSSGFSVGLAASPNAIPASVSPNQPGGCSNITAKVFDSFGRLVDGAAVTFTRTLGRFPVGDEEFDAVTTLTTLGIASVVLCAKDVRGTSIVTGTVEDGHNSVLVTIF